MQENIDIKCQSILIRFIKTTSFLKKIEDKGKLILEIQNFIDKYITPFLYNELQSTIQQRLGDVRFGLGLISYMQLITEWTKDWGKITYTHYLGEKENWENHIIEATNKNSNLSDISKALQNQDVFLKRIFSQKTFTAKILRRDKEAEIIVDGISLFGNICLSRSQTWEEIKENKIFEKSYPWAIIRKQDFPLVYLGIYDGENPIGFLQLQIYGWSRGKNKNNKRKYLFNCLLYFVNFLLREILMFLKQQLSKIENRKELNSVFNDKIINVVCGDQVVRNSDQSIQPHIREFKSYYDTGQCSPDQLALKTISALWSQNEMLEDTDLHKLNEAETTLYWAPNYRDHLIHSLKVFLLGNYLINILRQHKKYNRYLIKIIKKSLNLRGNDKEIYGRFQELWMLTATFHDFCMPVQKFSKVQKEQFKKFLGIDNLDSSEEFEGRMFLTDAMIREGMIFSLFHILHYYKEPPNLNSRDGEIYLAMIEGKEPFKPDIERSSRLRNLTRLGIFNHYILEHFIKNGDHGISSAIRFMKEYTNAINKYENLEHNFKAYFKVMEAIFIHNLFDKKRINGHFLCDKINFDDNPLSFILVLCDTIQDWGREELPKLVKKNGKKIYSYGRPFGSVEIRKGKKNEELYIYDNESTRLNVTVDYFYEYIEQYGEEKERRSCEIGVDKCNNIVKEICQSNFRENCSMDNECYFVKHLIDKYDILQDRLKTIHPLPTIALDIRVGGKIKKKCEILNK